MQLVHTARTSTTIPSKRQRIPLPRTPCFHGIRDSVAGATTRQGRSSAWCRCVGIRYQSQAKVVAQPASCARVG